jgi:signal transduction histidine kinase
MRAWAAMFVRWWRALPSTVVDVGVAGVVGAVVDIAIHVADEPDSRSPDLVAYLIGSAIGAVLLARRQRPVAVLFATAVLLFVYYTVGYPGIQPALPLAVALYAGAAAGQLRWSVSVAAFFIAAGVVVGGFRLHDPVLSLLTGTFQNVALLGAVIMLGVTVRSRHERLADARARLAEAERRREAAAAARVAEERLRIARDVHDIVGHSIAAITIQAGLARDLFDQRPEQAREALDVVAKTARHAMSDLKVTVGGLRADQADGNGWLPAPTLSDVDKLIEGAESLGLRATLSVTGEQRPLLGVVELSAYRIVQESLTNVVRHAKATTARVLIDYGAEELAIEVADDGVGPVTVANRPPGYGTVGMTERLAALGGRLTTGAGTDGGFVVRAWIPITEVR